MKKHFFLSLCIVVTSSIFAQHENCSHGDAPSIDSISQGKYIHTSNDALKAIGLKVATAKSKNFDTIVSAIGRIENIPENVDSITSRVAGRAIDVYVKKDSFLKKGSSICKVESFLAGNPPPSVVLNSTKSGVVEILNVFKGSGVEAGAELARVVDSSELYAVANVFESSLSRIKIGDKARIKIEALGSETIVEGVLVKFGASLNIDTNTLPAYFLIKNVDGKIRNGMRAVFSIITDSKASITIPVEALSEEDGLNYVYVQSRHEDGVFERRLVTSDRQNDIEAEIKNGLSQGENVAIKGIYQLRFFPRDNDPHNHSLEQHRAENKHSPKEHEHVEHEHNKDEHDNAEVEHDHSEHEAAHSFWSEYRQNLLVGFLAVSLLLNFAFALARWVSRKNEK